mgnify:CR=1 FL=1
MYFNAIFGVGTSGLKLKSTILKGPLLKSGVPPSRSSGELIISGYPVQVFIDKSSCTTKLLVGAEHQITTTSGVLETSPQELRVS